MNQHFITYKPPFMLRDKIIEIFVPADDFCISFAENIRRFRLESNEVKHRNRKASLTDSEIIAILVFFHYGSFTNFKHYYNHYVKEHLSDCFPRLVSYNRFIELQQRVAVPMMMFLKLNCLGKSRGINFVDSTHIKVCHNRRIHQHKVFKEVAERGICSIGWFYGFKLHLIINDSGEILSFYLTKGNVDDRNLKVMQSLTEDIFGKLFGDKGYISKALSDLLFADGVQLITKVKKNMKHQSLSATDKILLRKRAIIESVNDELKNICQLQHTRHRSINGFLFNIMSVLAAYSFFPKKPSLNIQMEKTNQLSLAA